MLIQYDEIINKQLWKHHPNFWDDLRGEAYLKFNYVRDNYDPAKGRFFSLAYYNIEMQMLNYIQNETCRWERKNIYRTLDNLTPNGEETYYDWVPETTDFEHDFIVKDYLDKFLAIGNEFQREYKKLYYIDRYSQRDVNVIMGLPYEMQSIKKKVDRARVIGLKA